MSQNAIDIKYYVNYLLVMGISDFITNKNAIGNLIFLILVLFVIIGTVFYIVTGNEMPANINTVLSAIFGFIFKVFIDYFGSGREKE